MEPLSPAHVAFGDAMRARRLELGLSQERLAEESGLHRTYIGMVERGERNIALRNMLELARALQASAAVFVVEAERADKRR